MAALEQESTTEQIIANLKASREILDQKIKNVEYVSQFIGLTDFITPPNRFNPEGRMPIRLQPDWLDAEVANSASKTIELIQDSVEVSYGSFHIYRVELEATISNLTALNSLTNNLEIVKDLIGIFNTTDIVTINRLLNTMVKSAPALYEGSIRSNHYSEYQLSREFLRRVRNPIDGELTGRELPRLEVLTNNHTVGIIDIDQSVFIRGNIPWQVFLLLAQNPNIDIPSVKLNQAAYEGGSEAYAPGPAAVGQLRRLFSQVSLNDLIISQGTKANRSYRLDASVSIDGKAVGTNEYVDTPSSENTNKVSFFDTRMNAMRRFVQDDSPAPTFQEMREFLGRNRKGRELQPQNILWTLRNAFTTLQGRVDSNLANDEERQLWEAMKSRIHEVDSNYALIQYRNMVSEWYVLQKNGDLTPEVEQGETNGQSLPKEVNHEEVERTIEQMTSHSKDGLIREADLTRKPGITFRLINELRRAGKIPGRPGRNPIYSQNEVRLILCSVFNSGQ